MVFINKPFYYYFRRPGSISQRGNDLTSYWDKRKNVLDATLKFIEIDKRYKKTSDFLKFDFKMKLRGLVKEKEHFWWFFLFKECNKNILKFEKELLKTRILWRILLSNYYFFRLFFKILNS